MSPSRHRDPGLARTLRARASPGVPPGPLQALPPRRAGLLPHLSNRRSRGSRPTRCAHGNLDRCTLTRDGSRPCGQRCRHNGWSRAALPSTDTPCPACHTSRPAPGASLPPTQAATRRPPEAIPPEPDLCGTCGDDEGHSGLRTCVICDDYIDPPEAGAGSGEPWPTDECDHWVHCGCLQGGFAQGADAKGSPINGSMRRPSLTFLSKGFHHCRPSTRRSWPGG